MAHLRMDPKLSVEDKERRVEEVINLMGLENVRDVVIGTPLK